MLTSYADDEALFEAIMAGASGYVFKQVSGSNLIAVRRVGSGESLLDPTVTARVLEQVTARRAARPRGRRAGKS